MVKAAAISTETGLDDGTTNHYKRPVFTKILLLAFFYSISSFLQILINFLLFDIWGEPEQAPHWLVVKLYIRASRMFGV